MVAKRTGDRSRRVPSPVLPDDETIAAVITPPGEGGIAALRVAGGKSLFLFNKHVGVTGLSKGSTPRPFQMYYGQFLDGSGEPVDEVLAVYMPAGHSYTGLEQVEIYCHGGRKVVQMILDELLRSGARAAEPGEFTKLAFLSGRIDLARAEAVAEIISAGTSYSFRAAREHLLGNYSDHVGMLRDRLIDVIAEVEASIDYPEDEIDLADKRNQLAILDDVIASVTKLIDSHKGGRIIREGMKVAIAGRPNAGKSSLFNLLLKQERALVTPTAGTTRDFLSEWIDLDGFAVNLIDTAGLRQAGGAIEKAGQASTRRIIDDADLLVWIFDLSQRNWKARLEKDSEEHGNKSMLLLANKIDMVTTSSLSQAVGHNAIGISCKTGDGIDRFRAELVKIIRKDMPDLTQAHVVTSARHAQKLSEAHRLLLEGRSKIESGESPELTAFDLRQAAAQIDEITGKVYNEEILGRIFSRFCIGK